MANNTYIKKRTQEIYDSLPQELSARLACIKERDEIIDLNYTFFGYIASHTYVGSTSVDYEDKLQSALLHFCECWWKYKWNGDETHRGYRSDLTFAVFFKPRISEMIRRELTEVKYSLRRSLCMEVGAQLNKPWTEVNYNDLSDQRLHISDDKMKSLKSIFGTVYAADLNDYELFEPAKPINISIVEKISSNDRYNSIERLLIDEMIRNESKLSNSDLLEISDIYQIDYKLLKDKLPIAEKQLYDQLKYEVDIKDI